MTSVEVAPQQRKLLFGGPRVDHFCDKVLVPALNALE
jgi:hypothetical protein